jgi:hypothetical protein
MKLLIIAVIGSLVILLPIATNQTFAFLKIKTPDKNAQVPAGKFITVTGTSSASNSTHARCNVQLQTNQGGYKPVTPLGPNKSYTNWSGVTSEPMKAGHNEIEGQLLCYPQVGTTPISIKHLVHNVTGVGMPTTTKSPSTLSIPSTPKAPIGQRPTLIIPLVPAK